MNAPRRRDSIAEGVIVALVVVVLGVAATRVRLEPPHQQVASVDRLAAQVRMQMPIAPDCMRSDAAGDACRDRLASTRP
jgi:hypothetical protein